VNKVFNIAFKTGIWGLLLLFVIAILFDCVEQIRGTKQPEPFLIVFQVGVFLAAVAWLLATLVLWVEGWCFIFQGWRMRSWLLNLVFIIALVFISVFAAYGFHVLRRRQQGAGAWC
jgi:hypothetical protein